MIRSPRAAQRNGLISKENFERFGSRPNPYILAGNKPKSDSRDYFSLTPKTKLLSVRSWQRSRRSPSLSQQSRRHLVIEKWPL
jgi:hypothetical protein